jgi:alkylation response protein AidB-like acyl-CoA dehydrogenase
MIDFASNAEQQEVTNLAGRIFADLASSARVAALESSGEVTDHALWRVLADSGLLGLAIEPGLGGSGLGFVEICMLLQQQGRRVAPVPLLATVVLGALPLSEWGEAEHRRRWLPDVNAGKVQLSGALQGVDPEAGASPLHVRTDGSRWLLSGELSSVPGASPDMVVVPVCHDGEWVLVLLDPSADGVRRERVATTDRQPHQHLHLTEVAVDRHQMLAIPAEGVRRYLDVAITAMCAVQVGVIEQALELTTTHVTQRHQFGRSIATFQAVQQRGADAYIELEAARLTMLHAACLLADDQSASAEAAAAKWWAATAGHHCLHSALHLHGGIGNDVEYPLHRYFLWSRQLGLELGGAAQQVDRLSRLVPQLSLTVRSARPTF